MNRRQFLLQTSQYSALAGGMMILPNFQFIDEFLYLGENFSIDAYKKDFQDLLPGKSSISQQTFNMATKKKLGLNYSDTEFTNTLGLDYGSRKILDSMKQAGFVPYTPPTKYRNTPNAGVATATASAASHTNTGVITKMKNTIVGKQKITEAGWFIGFEKVEKGKDGKWEASGKQNYIVFNEFLQYVQYEAYFCYGQPCSNPTSYDCLDCQENFVTQDFFYEGDSEYGRKKINFWNNAICKSPYSKGNAHNIKVHRVDKNKYPQLPYVLENLNLEPVGICVCAGNANSHKREISGNR